MKLKLPSRKRTLRWIGFTVLFLILAVYILLPISFGIVVVFPYKESVGDPPEGFEEVSLKTDDGVTLAGWFRPSTNGAVIILIHGAGGSRESVRGQAEMLTQHGYGVLALDLRGHGESKGTTNRLGWQGTHDVGAAVAFLTARDDVTTIGGLGSSLGAEVLLGAASAYPDVKAIVADGATHRTLDELKALPSERPLVRNFVSRVMYATVQVLSGDKPPKPLLESMVEAETTRFLLIAGGSNQQEVKYNELFAETVGERAELWVAPGAAHTGAFKKYRAEYEERVVAFFDAVLLGENQ
jgi:pimeloyl-ACP methyl ester carboxylesterase